MYDCYDLSFHVAPQFYGFLKDPMQCTHPGDVRKSALALMWVLLMWVLVLCCFQFIDEDLEMFKPQPSFFVVDPSQQSVRLCFVSAVASVFLDKTCSAFGGHMELEDDCLMAFASPVQSLRSNTSLPRSHHIV